MLEQITTTLYETMADAIEIVKMQEIDVLDYSHILKAILKHKYKGHELLLKMCRQSNKSIAFLENEIDTEVINFSQAQKVRTVTNDIRFSKRLENLLTLATNAVSMSMSQRTHLLPLYFSINLLRMVRMPMF